MSVTCKNQSIAVAPLFSLPVLVAGSGLAVGDERSLHFVYNKWFSFNTPAGDTTFRVLEQVNLSFAVLGWLMRLPGINQLLQIIVDGSSEQGEKVIRAQKSNDFPQPIIDTTPAPKE